MHEIVTLQFGNRANYLATHFWNTQESYFTYPTPTDPTPVPSPVDHDIHFRPGIGTDGSDTYTSRTLIYDFQSNFGGLRKLNALYDALRPDEVVKGLWDGIQQTHTLPPVQPITYQTYLESGLPTPQLHSRDVRYWSDFNRLFYHPRSIIPLSQQSLSSSLNAADIWNNGVDLFKDLDREADLLDRDVRPFVEECDSLSTFQIYSNVDDSWGGYTSTYVEALREEYGKKGIWIWAIEDGRRLERSKQYQRLANSARSLRALTQNVSAYVRLSTVPSLVPSYVRFEPEADWSTSALLCAAVESATLPARLRHDARGGGINLSLYEDTLNADGNQNIWTLKARARSIDNITNRLTSGSMSERTDTRIRQSSTEHDGPNNEDDHLEPTKFDINYTPVLPTAQTTFPSLANPQIRNDEHIFSQIESNRYFSATQLPTQNRSSSLEENIQRHYASESVVSIYNSPLAFPLLDSYPDDLFRVDTRDRKLLVDAALSTTSSTKHEILGLRDMVAGRTGRALGLIETDDVEAMYDDLTKIGEAYHWGWEGSEDEEEDE